MTQPSRIVDVHQHVFWHGRDEADLIADLDEQGIEKAVLLNWDVTALEDFHAYEGAFNPVHVRPDGRARGLPLADVVAAARRHPDRLLVGYCPHPLDPYAAEHLAAAVRMHDARLCGEWKATVGLDDPRCLNLFRACAAHGLAVLFHVDVPYRPLEPGGELRYCTEWYGGTDGNVERAVAACPETTFIAHGPGFWRHISGDAETAAAGYPDGPVAEGGRVAALLEALPNLHADLSAKSGLNALQRDPAHGRAFLLRYHDRLLFGRDGFGSELHEFLQSLELPAEAVENIYHRNAERLLRRPT